MTWKYLRRYLADNGLTYKQYLASDHWQDLRRRVWASPLHKKRCYACGAKERLEVHHKTYRRIGHEWLMDLCLMCRECHQAAHDFAKLNPKAQDGKGLRNAARRIRKVFERTGQRTPKAPRPRTA